MDSIKKELTSFKKDFDALYKHYLNLEYERANGISKKLGYFFKSMVNYSLSGGKRIRPFLFYESFRGLSRKRKDLLDLSVFSEMIHAELLALDDIMDKSDLRHGVLTVHKNQEVFFRKKYFKNEAASFGISAGILAGLIYGHMANEIISKNSTFQSQRLQNLLAYYNEVVIETAYGQYLDLLLPYEKSVNEDDVGTVHLYKTAKYTIEAPLVGGAILADSSKEELEKISAFAVPLGLAFQIQDDLIGIFGDPKKTGKSNCSDLIEGKETYLTTFVRKNGGKEEANRMRSLLKKKKIEKNDLESFKRIVRESGASDYAKKRARKLLEKSLSALFNTPFRQKTKTKLAKLAKYIVKRDL